MVHDHTAMISACLSTQSASKLTRMPGVWKGWRRRAFRGRHPVIECQTIHHRFPDRRIEEAVVTARYLFPILPADAFNPGAIMNPRPGASTSAANLMLAGAPSNPGHQSSGISTRNTESAEGMDVAAQRDKERAPAADAAMA